MTLGALSLAISNKIRTNFSESPFHLLARVEAPTLKNVVPISDAKALASMVYINKKSTLPVPGGPYKHTPFHGRLIPLKNSGIRSGSTTASLSKSFASVRPAMSSQFIVDREDKISFEIIFFNSLSTGTSVLSFKVSFFVFSLFFFSISKLLSEALAF
eukprot:NODE_46_length_32145_cov_0.918711.p24 type:complete len:158 gc:universal NODE_46_length_32145_cov_0.918711:11797-11324(-)